MSRAPDPGLWQAAARALALGGEVTMLLLAGAALGQWIDSQWAYAPAATSVGVLLGALGAVRAFSRFR